MIENSGHSIKKCGGCRNDSVINKQVPFEPETPTVVQLHSACQELIGSIRKKFTVCTRCEYETKIYSNFVGSYLDFTKTMLNWEEHVHT